MNVRLKLVYSSWDEMSRGNFFRATEFKNNGGSGANRAAYFAPLLKKEKLPYWLYQISNGAIVLCLLFQSIVWLPTWIFFTGLTMSLAGLTLLLVSVVHFAAPAENGFCKNGVYRLSRNPMYVAYFVFFLGCALMTHSLLLFALVLLFQITAHRIIRAEERWCSQKFGEEYLAYQQRVRRYL